jgi:uracil-DNA glycosylase
MSVTDSPSVKLDSSWMSVIGDEFQKPYMQQLRQFLQSEKENGKIIYPPGSLWFNAFNSTPFDKVKGVILEQDPYHGPHQAHGLCFSVQKGIPFPPSLQNIFKELKNDLGLPFPSHGCLQHWAEQGVLLLNAVLTVEQGNAGAHQNRGWETFTDAAFAALNKKRAGLVFLLWGSYAQKKGIIIDQRKHLVLQSAHPSPLSAHRGFLGNQHFSKTNTYLKNNGQKEIDWALPN